LSKPHCALSLRAFARYIGVRFVGTRSKIAAELISRRADEEQKTEVAAKFASAETLRTAVFTDANTGPIWQPCAPRGKEARYRSPAQGHGSPTRPQSRFMTLLARHFDPKYDDYKGPYRMFPLPKNPRALRSPFPPTALTGGEIEVLGYRALKE